MLVNVSHFLECIFVVEIMATEVNESHPEPSEDIGAIQLPYSIDSLMSHNDDENSMDILNSKEKKITFLRTNRYASVLYKNDIV